MTFSEPIRERQDAHAQYIYNIYLIDYFSVFSQKKNKQKQTEILFTDV